MTAPQQATLDIPTVARIMARNMPTFVGLARAGGDGNAYMGFAVDGNICTVRAIINADRALELTFTAGAAAQALLADQATAASLCNALTVALGGGQADGPRVNLIRRELDGWRRTYRVPPELAAPYL